jgi:hypothetical protein
MGDHLPREKVSYNAISDIHAVIAYGLSGCLTGWNRYLDDGSSAPFLIGVLVALF